MKITPSQIQAMMNALTQGMPPFLHMEAKSKPDAFKFPKPPGYQKLVIESGAVEFKPITAVEYHSFTAKKWLMDGKAHTTASPGADEIPLTVDLEAIRRAVDYEMMLPIWRRQEDAVMADLARQLNQPARHTLRWWELPPPPPILP